MLIVSMGAGLGNQMYEYAFYEYLKYRYPNQEIKVDSRYAFPIAHNGIEVFDIFSLKAPMATKEEVLSLARKYMLNGEGFEKKSIVDKVMRKLKLYPSTMFVQRDFTEYYKAIEELDDGRSYYLYGPFANYYYFKDIEDNIKELFSFPEITEQHNKRYEKAIVSSNSVSIHVRKGDYVKEKIQLTPIEFYKKAVEIILDKAGEAMFFIFTDDNKYARSLFPDEEHYIVVEGNRGKLSYRDMQLMSLCKHNITCNSTFSFWGAYLNNNNKKIVVAPNLPVTRCKNAFVCDDWVIV